MQSGVTTWDQNKCLTTQTVAVDATEMSQHQIQFNYFFPVSVIWPLGELAKDLDYKKNTAYSVQNRRLGLFPECQHFNKENKRIIVTFKTDLTKYIWEFLPWRGNEALNQRARSDGAEKSLMDRTKSNNIPCQQVQQTQYEELLKGIIWK